VEELFWRGFLMRFLVDQDRPLMKIPFGTHRWRVFWIVTVAVMLIHNTSDWPGAFVWGSLMYFLAVRTKSLGACIVMHAVGNLLLGLYVMKTGLWGFW
jgi:CAAX prenyl protease-like protein